MDLCIYVCIEIFECREKTWLQSHHLLIFAQRVFSLLLFFLSVYPMSSTRLHFVAAARALIDECEWNFVIVAMSHLEYTWSFKNNHSSFFKENIKLYPMVFPCVAHILLIYCDNKDGPHLCDIVVDLGVCTMYIDQRKEG